MMIHRQPQYNATMSKFGLINKLPHVSHFSSWMSFVFISVLKRKYKAHMGQRKVLLVLAAIVLVCMLPKVSASIDFIFDAQPDPELQKYFQPQNSGWYVDD